MTAALTVNATFPLSADRATVLARLVGVPETSGGRIAPQHRASALRTTRQVGALATTVVDADADAARVAITAAEAATARYQSLTGGARTEPVRSSHDSTGARCRPAAGPPHAGPIGN